MHFIKYAKSILVAILALSILPFVAHAAPAVSTVSGTVTHGASVTVSGSGFGTKSTAAPVVWDDCSGINITAKWSGGWPNNSSNSTYDVAY